jgi:RNA polymerase sigma factor (sigma-70 family)
VVAECQAGDNLAFSRIVAAYKGLVCSVAYSMTGDLQQSEDIAQEAFFEAWRHMADLRDPHKLPTWLCSIVRNMARDTFRRNQRDPLSQATSLEDHQVTDECAEPSSMAQSERLALLWKTLADIPEEYREPLVLYYRQGHSIRDVAEALDLTENCVKQRLSRGRKMLKAHVERLVEDTLEETRPNEAFTSSVMAALPLVAIPTGLTTTVAGGSAATGKVVAGAQLAAVAGSLAGPLIGMTGGFFGMWASIRNSATLRLRRAMLVCCNVTYAFVWTFLGYEALCGIIFWEDPTLMFTLCGLGWAAYIPLLLILILLSNRWVLHIAKEDAGQLPAPATPLEQSDLSRRRVWLSFVATFPLALLASIAIVIWLQSMMQTTTLWPAAMCAIAIVHYIYFALFRSGMAIARDEEAFRSSPPKRNLDEVLAAPLESHAPTKRALFYNDLAALSGMILGPMAPAFASSLSTNRYPLSFLIGILCTSALFLGLRMRSVPNGRGWGYFIVCMYMGVACGICTAVTGPHRLVPGQNFELPGFAAGLIPFAMYWCIGIALFFILKSQKTPKR